MSFTFETACDVRFTGVLGAVSTFGVGAVVVVVEAIVFNLLERSNTLSNPLYYTPSVLILLGLLRRLDDFEEPLVAMILTPCKAHRST
jgi:hypothetical protein